MFIDIKGSSPQGSVLGPTFWNMIKDGLLDVDLGPGSLSVAYADDLVIQVQARSQFLVEVRANAALEAPRAWALNNKLEISVPKIQGLIMKGEVSEAHPP